MIDCWKVEIVTQGEAKKDKRIFEFESQEKAVRGILTYTPKRGYEITQVIMEKDWRLV